MSKKTDAVNKMTVISIVMLSVISMFLFCGCGGLGKSGDPIEFYVNAITMREMGRHEQAIQDLDKAIDKQEDFSLAYSLKGDIYQEMGRFNESAQAYKTASQLNPWSFHDLFNLGKVYHVMKQFAQAVKAYTRACDLEPEHFQVHMNTAKCYMELKQYEQALVYGRQAGQINPDVPELHEIIGDIYQKKDDQEKAISAYKRALELDSDNPQIKTSLGISYLKADRTEPAKELLDAAVKLDPQNSRALRYLGYCYLKFYEQASAQYRQALQQEEKDQVRIDQLQLESRHLMGLALENYRMAVNANPDDWDAHRGLGVAYIIEGKTDDGSVEEINKQKAITHWRVSLQVNPDQPRADKLRDLIAKYRRD
jgi:tetratricopeptide (TPR) repeat protein